MLTYLAFTILAVAVVVLVILLSLREQFSKNIIQAQGKALDSSRVVSEELTKLYEKIGGLDRESRQILQLTKSFHDILKPTKARGELGESILENLLRDVLPEETVIAQYGFKDGKKVDFVIKLPQGLVPIDAKFSLEVFQSYFNASEEEKVSKRKACIESIKKRIQEASAYIYPDEATSDFCLMYVPSEAVYYFIITETSLLEFAHQKKVFIVGPSTLYAYLKTIFIGFQAMKIEKRAKKIYADLQRLEKDVNTFIREYGVLGTHLRSAASKYDDVAKRADNISSKLNSIGGDSDDHKGESDPPGQKNPDHSRERHSQSIPQ
ncbi:MAG: DNA recombination protein RmuC [Candidatus Omnitrophica bacterium]|nr:DNA recombination protein RmuC [Candidatus Omnitrophota bacterium]MBU2044698.1 DNA recombination protein RmuC [Candidatus Omnitrophota bacterium]MBU2251580.1 DNA recombination protein RmuC [Candidatus Omnitrophota bacterium]MBU2473467.1 DNA recombination protein RmuC [Candidatus Omnitrophota bacterium]